MGKVNGTPIDYSLLTEKQREELSRLIQSVANNTSNIGAVNSQKEVNKAIQAYFDNLKKTGKLGQKREEPFQPKTAKAVAQPQNPMRQPNVSIMLQ